MCSIAGYFYEPRCISVGEPAGQVKVQETKNTIGHSRNFGKTEH